MRRIVTGLRQIMTLIGTICVKISGIGLRAGLHTQGPAVRPQDGEQMVTAIRGGYGGSWGVVLQGIDGIEDRVSDGPDATNVWPLTGVARQCIVWGSFGFGALKNPHQILQGQMGATALHDS
jgi:hypothetical protein